MLLEVLCCVYVVLELGYLHPARSLFFASRFYYIVVSVGRHTEGNWEQKRERLYANAMCSFQIALAQLTLVQVEEERLCKQRHGERERTISEKYSSNLQTPACKLHAFNLVMRKHCETERQRKKERNSRMNHVTSRTLYVREKIKYQKKFRSMTESKLIWPVLSQIEVCIECGLLSFSLRIALQSSNSDSLYPYSNEFELSDYLVISALCYILYIVSLLGIFRSSSLLRSLSRLLARVSLVCCELLCIRREFSLSHHRRLCVVLPIPTFTQKATCSGAIWCLQKCFIDQKGKTHARERERGERWAWANVWVQRVESPLPGCVFVLGHIDLYFSKIEMKFFGTEFKLRIICAFIHI